MHKNGDLENEVRVKVDWLNLIMIEEAMEEITRRRPNPR
jgi:hypothetical protein